MKIRKDRWEHREVLKERANRDNHDNDQHPQVRRQIEEEQYQRKEHELDYETTFDPETQLYSVTIHLNDNLCNRIWAIAEKSDETFEETAVDILHFGLAWMEPELFTTAEEREQLRDRIIQKTNKEG